MRTITLVVIVRIIVAGAFADNFLPVSDNDRNGLLFTITIDFHVNGAADRAICNDVQERRARTDLCSVDFGDDIAGANTGLGCRTSRHDILDHNAAFRLEPERAAQRCVLSRIGAVLDSYTAARYLPALNKLVVHLDRRVGWKRKSKPGGLPRFGNDGCVDSNNFSGHIDQGTAAVAWVNGCVGLQEALEVVPGAADLGTAFSADDAVRDGMIEAERASNRQYPVPDFDGIGVPQL